MIKHAQQVATAATEPMPTADAVDQHIAPAPRVSIQAFCETVETAAAVQAAGEDRRMAKTHVKIQMGGITAAVEAYRSSPTPNIIIVEADNHAEHILDGLDRLAEVCDATTRVIVVGRVNDVTFYRELTRRGVSEYLIAPVGTIDIVRAISLLFATPNAKPVGRIIAVVGAKGGVGASTVAHNIGWAIARDLTLDAVVTDLDLAFGTAGLDYNQDPPQGIADAVFSPDRIDTAFIDRLLSKCTDHLSLLAAPATLDRVYDFGAEAFNSIFGFSAQLHPLRRARRAASVGGLDQAPIGERGRYSRRRRAGPRQFAQRQEPGGFAARRAAERPSSVLLPQSGRRAEAAGDHAGGFRQGAGRPADRRDPLRTADLRHGSQ